VQALQNKGRCILFKQGLYVHIYGISI
jgi:hypothetical protein